MFTTIANRYKKNLHKELNFLSERIEIDGLNPDHEVRLACYHIDALKFKPAIKKLKEVKLAFPNNKKFSKVHDQGVFLHILYDAAHDYYKTPTEKKLRKISQFLMLAANENLYPRLERYVEEKIYVDILKRKTIIEPSTIATLTRSFYSADSTFINNLKVVGRVDDFIFNSEDDKKRFDDIISHVSKCGAFLGMLQAKSVVDLLTERFLTNIRRTFLINHKKIKPNNEYLLVLSALSAQNFLNEYVNTVSNEEKIVLEAMKEELLVLENWSQVSEQFKLLIFSCYEGLGKFEKYLIGKNCSEVTAVPRLFLTQQTVEHNFKENMPSYLRLKDETSKLVQSQYEKNPYPRWESMYLPEKKRSIGNWLSSFSSKFKNEKISEIDYPKILVAGTGTGQQSIGSAAIISGASVDALDLSKSSLGYALRKSKELGIENIKFLQADLFETDFIKTKYDIIQCSGVLHHTSDPLEGLKKLKSKLSSHGIIQIGLYSRFARYHLNKIRNEIAKRSLGSSRKEMLDFRKELLDGKLFENEVQVISKWGDFFSTSMFRDLCFHAHETQYDCHDLQRLVDEAGMKFVCMMLPLNKKQEYYRKTGELAEHADLNDWYEFELNNTFFFSEMYNFFVKPKW
jgi:2-polyprenyl-3-methyl-5-hydroxy-6-metoxy-1,4-benzoquinol methylase